MKRLTFALTILSLLLTACGGIRPLGFCQSDGLFYYRTGNALHSSTPAEVQARGFDPYAYGNWCPGSLPTPTPTEDLPEPTPTPTDDPGPGPTPTPTEEPGPEATPIPTEEPAKRPSGPTVAIPMVWLLTRGDWDCILVSETHPSVPRQQAKCFPLLDPNWVADNAPCAAPVMDDDTWECDRFTPWRRPLAELLVVYEEHLRRLEGD